MKPKIFISSTCFDLIDMRHEVKEFLEAQNFNPIMSDQTNSDFKVSKENNSIETCLVNLRECEIVVFILSKRYGPTLGKCGFEDVSATHLEYKEAVKENKHIIFFVRDRLESDFLTYKKTKDDKSFLWIQPYDKGLFDIIDERRKLKNDDKNNWYWTFKSSIDVKERLAIELKTKISETRFNQILESGKAPFVSLHSNWDNMDTNTKRVNITLNLENIGQQPAIDPLIVFTRAESYQQILEENFYDDFLNYELHTIKSLKASESNSEIIINLILTQEDIQSRRASFVVEILYKTIFGDTLSDIVELKIDTSLYPDINISCSFMIKRYVSDKAFERIISQEKSS